MNSPSWESGRMKGRSSRNVSPASAFRLRLMAEEEAKRKVRAELRNAQAAFERAEVQREKVSTTRRETFEGRRQPV